MDGAMEAKTAATNKGDIQTLYKISLALPSASFWPDFCCQKQEQKSISGSVFQANSSIQNSDQPEKETKDTERGQITCTDSVDPTEHNCGIKDNKLFTWPGTAAVCVSPLTLQLSPLDLSHSSGLYTQT
ncbi:hypothetical protein ElyMa_002257300 [Elysia marginata]|uniref:Uncharacterized protein n=1 Tax=Elysia marginata TaxID=1093978 RepID=A0AAV4FZL5_9GAST|nr:hypothetical protein ElyMa_002257300 [Elysia marginata]